MSQPWMPLYIGDYLADTAHLRAVEHGAYLLLIMHYWRTGSLPDDDAALARIARMGNAEWKRIRSVIFPLFEEGWKHKRIEFELTEAARISEAGRKGGQASGAARRAKAQRSGDDLETTVERPLNDSSNDRATTSEALPSPSPSPKKEKESLSAPEGATGSVIDFPKYAFEGRIIRLKQDQFDRWVKVFSAIPDLPAALEAADAYYSENPPADGKWFFPVSRWLEKENAKAKTDKRRAGYGTDWM